MNLNELIEEALKLQSDGLGECEVNVWADHGQDTTKAHTITIFYSDGEEVYEDLEDAKDSVGDETKIKKIIEISG